MMRPKYAILLIILGLGCLPLVAQPAGFSKVGDGQDIRDKIQRISKQTNALQCDFVQEKQLSFLEQPITSKGKFWYKDQDKIRWEYNTPYQYQIILNGGKMKIDDEGNVNTMDLRENKMFRKINTMVQQSFTGAIVSDETSFSYTIFESQSQVLIRLIPKDKQFKEYLTAIELYFSKKDFLLAAIIMQETSSDFTKITFSQRSINPSLGDALFSI